MQSEKQQSESDQKLDILWGAQAIAEFLGTTERKVWYQADRGLLPVKRQGRLLTASRSALRKHFATPDAATTAAPAEPSPPLQHAEQQPANTSAA
jgi:hypothetical protein